MEPSNLMQVALRFNEKINAQDPEGLAELMTDDHTFTDNEGNVTKGKNIMKEGWRDFFNKYPDYRNRFTNVMVLNNIVIMIGYSTCSFKPLDGPNIWTAKIQDERVSEWRVYWLGKR
jgi:uncharacterized protein (TIGR02246 family)